MSNIKRQKELEYALAALHDKDALVRHTADFVVYANIRVEDDKGNLIRTKRSQVARAFSMREARSLIERIERVKTSVHRGYNNNQAVYSDEFKKAPNISSVHYPSGRNVVDIIVDFDIMDHKRFMEMKVNE